MKIYLRKTLLYFGFFFAALAFVYSNVNRPFVVNGLFQNTYVTSNRVNWTSNYLNIGYVACLYLCSIFSINHFRKDIVSKLLVIGVAIMQICFIFWTMIGSSSAKTVDMLFNNSTTPLAMLISASVFIGYRDELWKSTKKIVFLLCTLFTVILLYETVRFVLQYGLMIRLMTSAAVYAMVYAILLMYVNLLLNTEALEKHPIMLFLQVFTLIVVAMVLQSRSWMLHGVILLAIYVKAVSAASKSKHLVRALVILLIIAIVVCLWQYLLLLSGSLLARLNSDSRSQQLIAFFSQVTVKDLLFGCGVDARYNCFGTSYAYLDNLILLTMFKFGTLPTLIYLLMMLRPIFYGLRRKKSQVRSSVLFFVAWLACMMGVSIYVANAYTVYNQVIYIVIGRMFYLMKTEKESMRSNLPSNTMQHGDQ